MGAEVKSLANESGFEYRGEAGAGRHFLVIALSAVIRLTVSGCQRRKLG